VAHKVFSSEQSVVRVLVADTEVLRAGGWEEASALAAEMPDSRNPFLIERGDTVSLSLESGSRAEVLSRLVPSSDLEVELYERASGIHDDLEWDRKPIDTNNEIDGTPWGWFMVTHYIGDRGTPVYFRLLPLSFQEDSEVVAWTLVSTDLGTGLFIEAGYKHDAFAGLTWYWMEATPESTLEVTYTLPDRIAQAQKVIAMPMEEGLDPFCGECEENEDWETKIKCAPTIPLDAVGSAIATFWQPCDEHVHTWQPEVAGHQWRWAGDTWRAS